MELSRTLLNFLFCKCWSQKQIKGGKAGVGGRIDAYLHGTTVTCRRQGLWCMVVSLNCPMMLHQWCCNMPPQTACTSWLMKECIYISLSELYVYQNGRNVG